MASLINWNKSTATLLSTQLVQTATIVASGGLGCTGKDAVTVMVRHGRTTTQSQGATVFTIEQSPSGGVQGNDWVPLTTWTTALHGSAATTQTLSATAAASATTIQLSGSLASANSTPLFIYNTGDATISEWNWQKLASTATPLLNPLANAQTATTAIVFSYAEMWSLQLDVHDIQAIRITVNTTWNGMVSPIVVHAQAVTADALSAT